MSHDSSQGTPISDTGRQLFVLAEKVLGLIKLVVLLLMLVVLGLLVFYAFLITQPETAVTAAPQLKDLIVSLWTSITPYVSNFIQLVAPVFVLIFALGFLHRLQLQGASPFDIARLMSDLPSALALLIIATICLLPLAGLRVPDVLNNIALVVVGFYFGKRKTSDEI